MRKTSSRVILQIQEGAAAGVDSSKDGSRPPPRTSTAGARSSSFAAGNVDTLVVILGIAVFLAVVGLFFVHRMSAAVSDSMLMDQETRGTGLF